MGYRTDFVGAIEVQPPLNEAEWSYLVAFTESRRCRYRRGGAYAVPDNPLAESLEARPQDVDDFNTAPAGQPDLWCPWKLGGPGWLCIPDHGDGRHYAPGAWLQYLIDHFLKEGALASRHASSWCHGFSFDHTLSGAVAAFRADTGRLWLIRACGDRVVEESLA